MLMRRFPLNLVSVLLLGSSLAGCAMPGVSTTNSGLSPTGSDRSKDSGDPWLEPLRDASLQGGCMNQLDLLPRPEGLGIWAVSLPEAMAGADVGSIGLPADILHLKPGSPLHHPCLLMVDFEPAAMTSRTLLEAQTVKSAKLDVTGAADKLTKRSAKSLKNDEDDRGSWAVRTGNPLIDLVGSAAVGLLGLVGSVIEGAQNANLRNVKASSEEPGFQSQPYTYQAQEVATERAGLYRFAVHDPLARKTWRSERWRREDHQLLMSDTQDKNDVGPIPALPVMTAQAVGRWEAGLPALPFNELRTILEHAAVDDTTSDPAAVRRHWQQLRHQKTAASHASTELLDVLVVLRHMGGESVGVFVGPETVLTSTDTLPDGGLIEVLPHYGTTSFAVVRRRDEKRGLAVLYVPKTLPVLELALGDAVGPGRALADGKLVSFGQKRVIEGTRERILIHAKRAFAPGTPLVSGGRLKGLITRSIGHDHEMADAEAIGLFLDDRSVDRHTALSQ